MTDIQSIINEMLDGMSSDIIAKHINKDDVSNQLLLNYSLDGRIVCAIDKLISLDHSLEITIPVAEVLANGLPFEWDKIAKEFSEIFSDTYPWEWQQEICTHLEKMIAEDFVTLFFYTLYHTFYDDELFELFKQALNVRSYQEQRVLFLEYC